MQGLKIGHQILECNNNISHKGNGKENLLQIQLKMFQM